MRAIRLTVRLLLLGTLFAGTSLLAQSVSIEQLTPAAKTPAAPRQPGAPIGAALPTPAQGGAGKSTMPLRQIAVYKNGVALFERSGFVTGDALIHIDFTTAQLNDVLQSLTATDQGGGSIAGLGYDNSATLGQQLAQLHLNLGPDPTVSEFLDALKGKQVQVHGGGPDVTGKLLNVEVRVVANPKTGDKSEHRFVSMVTAKGGLRTIQLTPLVEVRLMDAEQRTEIGHYLQILGTTHNPPLRHLTLEARGTGKREIRISYIGALPAWKSNYRVLVTNSAEGAKTATLQGWAVVDNPSDNDWDNVLLTLVSGAPQSFIQQISRPDNIQRPEVGMQGGVIGAAPARPRSQMDLIGAGQGTAVPIKGGMQVVPAKIPAAPQVAATVPADSYQQEAKNSLAPQTTSVALDDLFEYKLDKPMTIRAGESAVIPILQTTVDAERVSLWLSHEQGRGVQRALWLRNNSALTFDQGSFTITENGMFGGQGQIPLMHPGERRLTPYAADDVVKVAGKESKEPPSVVQHIEIKDGNLSVHRKLLKQHVYTIENDGATPRTVVLGLHESAPQKNMGPWQLSKENPADETIAEPGGNLYRFAVQVDAHSTKTFTMLEWHSHPYHTPLGKMSVDDLAAVIKDSGNNAEVIAKLQPIMDAKKKLADLDAQLKDAEKGIGEVNAEEGRLRQNIATLKGSAEEKPLTKRYADAMLAQEDKLAALQTQRDAARQQKVATEKTLADQIHALQTDIQIAANTAPKG